jgi:undecaprenyl-diphosphatase
VERSAAIPTPLTRWTAARPQRHPGDVIRVVAGAAILGGGAVVARQGLDRIETDVFRLVNDLPGVLAPVLIAVMQSGSFVAVPAAALVGLATRRPRLARDVGMAGTVAYLLAKVAKALVARGRPAELLGAAVLRGASDTGLGFPSGHVAVAAARAGGGTPGRKPKSVTHIVAVDHEVGQAQVAVGDPGFPEPGDLGPHVGQ